MTGEVLVYMDEGVDAISARHTLCNLRGELMGNRRVRRVTAEVLLCSSWEESTQLLVIPGGRDLAYVRSLGESGARRIREWVESGGHYLGICAGAYFGCRSVQFERGGPLEVVGERHLHFYPGRGVGPILTRNPFSYREPSGADIAQLHWVSDGLYKAPYSIYYNGGCTFSDGERSVDVEVLARYNEVEGKPPAIVQCNVGKGIALLSGVHPEYSVALMDLANPWLSRLRIPMEQAEEGRKALFRELLTRLLVS